MPALRLIARVDLKGDQCVKGVHLEGIRQLGPAVDFVSAYAGENGHADELLLMDAVASLYSRAPQWDVIERITEHARIPITFGGGLRSVDDMAKALLSGADKVAINTAAIANPSIICEAAHRFGAQAVVVHIDAKRTGRRWEAYAETGREPTGKDAVEWAETAAELGAGEVLITSIDREGTRAGFDVELVAAVASAVDIPVVACGGCGSIADVLDVYGLVDGIAIAGALHSGAVSIRDVKQALAAVGVKVRPAA